MSDSIDVCPVCRFPAWGFDNAAQHTEFLKCTIEGTDGDFTKTDEEIRDRVSLQDSIRTTNCPGCVTIHRAHTAVITDENLYDEPWYLIMDDHVGMVSLPIKPDSKDQCQTVTVLDVFDSRSDNRIRGISYPKSGLDPSWEQVKLWVSECTEKHVLCNEYGEKQFLPDRLVCVDWAQETVIIMDSDAVRDHCKQTSRLDQLSECLFPDEMRNPALRDLGLGPDDPVSTPRYITLSHCWGNTKSSLMLTIRNFQSHTTGPGVAISELPQTFQDAIQITRKFAVRFIWIDSLCIIQDSSDDWNQQAPLMASIYSHSWLTIAATASASDAAGFSGRDEQQPRSRNRKTFDFGLPWQQNTGTSSQRDKTYRVQIDGGNRKIQIHVRQRRQRAGHQTGPQTKEEPPLLTRGWVFQERLLSRRVVHFCRNELMWECMEGTDCECATYPLALEPAPYSPISSRKLSRHFYRGQGHADGPTLSLKDLYSVAMLKSSPKGSVYEKWRRVVRRYSSLKLTFGDDRLPAVSGVAKQFRDVLKDEYLAGCWRRSLPLDLAWRLKIFPEGRSRLCSKYSIPSWSWASAADGEVVFIERDNQQFRVLSSETCSVTDDTTGRVNGGALILLAKTFKIRLSHDTCDGTATSDLQKMKSAEKYCRDIVVFKADNSIQKDMLFEHAYLFPDYQFWTDLGDLRQQLESELVMLVLTMSTGTMSQSLLLRPSDRDEGNADRKFERIAFIEHGFRNLEEFPSSEIVIV